MSVARFKVAHARPIDGKYASTVLIDRERQTISVRPKYRWRWYTLPLSYVAEQIVWKVVGAELAEKNRETRKKRVRRKGA